MKNIQEKLSFEWEKYQKKGQFNVNDFVNKYGADIASGHLENIPFDKLDIFEQKDFIKKLHLMPNKIRVRLVLDGSGSMTQGEDKIKKPLKNSLYFYIKKWYNRSSLNQLNMHKTYV